MNTNLKRSNLTIHHLMDQLASFEDKVEKLMIKLSINEFNLKCDHIALRVNDLQTAVELHQNFELIGQVISDKIINGRPIIIIKLNEPLFILNQKVDYIELPYPSSRTYPIEGWEHIELILPCDATTSAQLKSALLKFQPKLLSVFNAETDIKIKMSSPSGDNESVANPTIAFKHNHICVKIHPHSIEKIVTV